MNASRLALAKSADWKIWIGPEVEGPNDLGVKTLFLRTLSVKDIRKVAKLRKLVGMDYNRVWFCWEAISPIFMGNKSRTVLAKAIEELHDADFSSSFARSPDGGMVLDLDLRYISLLLGSSPQQERATKKLIGFLRSNWTTVYFSWRLLTHGASLVDFNKGDQFAVGEPYKEIIFQATPEAGVVLNTSLSPEKYDSSDTKLL